MDTQDLTGRPGSGDLQIHVTSKPPEHEPHTVTYSLTPEQAIFFKGETGISNDDDLKAHILNVQERAYKIYPYPCIKILSFLRLGISRQPEYKEIIKLGRERSEGILLDIGCCFGVDARKVVSDGFPLKNVVTSDLMPEFFDMGHALFRTTPETYPINFVAGDVLDPKTLQIVPPFNQPPSTERPDLTTLKSLNPLAGHCSVIYVSNLFHLFLEENQCQLAKALGGLLSPEPGSMICGVHAGGPIKGVFHVEYESLKFNSFLHCPESWTTLWDGDVFSKGTVRVNVNLEQGYVSPVSGYHPMRWSVVRL